MKTQPRPVEGRCASCVHLDICGCNTRVCAEQITGNPWAEDPGCYLDEHGIGLHCDDARARVAITPCRSSKSVIPISPELTQ